MDVKSQAQKDNLGQRSNLNVKQLENFQFRFIYQISSNYMSLRFLIRLKCLIANPSRTLADTSTKFDGPGSLVVDLTLYRNARSVTVLDFYRFTYLLIYT